MVELILIRGLPGSGKSTLAKKFAKMGYFHFEADMYFGEPYVFDASKLSDAHKWCQSMTIAALDIGKNVVVSNTFSRKWEMEAYLRMKARITILTCEGQYANVHNVPEHAIKRMADRWEAF